MIHPAAESGFEKGVDAYRRSRPAYHPEIVARLVERYVGGRVADVGAGSGALTRALADAGVDLVAVEPVPAMRAALVETLPGVAVVDGTAEGLPFDDGSLATVVAAQAAHWFRYPDATDEISRVLAPGGYFVTVWNVRDDTVGWARAYGEIVSARGGDAPRHGTGLWRRAIESDSRYVLVDDWSIAHPWPTTPDGVVDRALSTSFIAALPDDERERVAAEIRAIVEPLGESVDFPYRGELQAWRVDG